MLIPHYNSNIKSILICLFVYSIYRNSIHNSPKDDVEATNELTTGEFYFIVATEL